MAKVILYESAGVLNLTPYDFGYDNAYLIDYEITSFASGLKGITIQYSADGALKRAKIAYDVDLTGKYQPLIYQELQYNYSTRKYETLYQITDLDVYGYSLESMVDDIVYAKANHGYLVSGNDTIYGNSYGGFFDTGIGNDIIYGYGGNDSIWIGAGSDTAYGGAGNDIFYTTSSSSYFSGTNYVYGESGIDKLYVSDSQTLFRLVDVWGEYGFGKGQDFLYLQGNTGGSLIASGIELIQSYDIGETDINNWNYSDAGPSGSVVFRRGYSLDDKNYSSNNTKYTIDLSEYVATNNYYYTTRYEFELSDGSYNDQFSISGDTILISNGSGTTRSVNVTITASGVSNTGEVKSEPASVFTGESPNQKTFSVTFKDNDSSSVSPNETSGDDGYLSYSLISSSTSVLEGETVSFKITSSSAVSSDRIYSWKVTGDSNGSTIDEATTTDVDALSGQVTISSGSSSATFKVTSILDDIVEGLEGIKVSIFDSNSKIIASDIIIIKNNLGYELSDKKNDNGPDLIEFSKTFKSEGVLNHTENNEMLILTGQAGTVRGLMGDDTYFISNLMTNNSKMSIVDTEGKNTIQIPDNTLIIKGIFAPTATKLTLGNNQEVTINSADKFTFNLSGNSAGGDIGTSLTYSDFVKLFGIELLSSTQTVNDSFYTKSSENSSSIYNIINISGTEDTSIIATNKADEFRYEINNDGTSAEGAYTYTIIGFDKSNDKLTLVNTTGKSELTTSEFDSIRGVDVVSDELSGTQIFFAPNDSGQSGTLILKDVVETFSGKWLANSYIVEIIPLSSLYSSSADETSYKFSSSLDNSDPILLEFNSSLSPGTINFSDQDDFIILTGSGSTARGFSGDDTYFVSNLIPKNSKISIVDTNGDNTIQIPDNTLIAETLFTKNAVRLKLDGEKEVTISNADDFIYSLGSNKTTGDKGSELSFTDFASAFGVNDILSLDGSTNGTIVDQYII